MGNGPFRGQPGPHPQRPARPGAPAHRWRPQDRSRHCHRRDPRRGRVRHRNAVAGRDGLHHGAPVPFEHLPGRRLHAGRSLAFEVRRHARKGHQPDDLHRRRGARHPRSPGRAQPRRGDRPHRIAPPGQPRRRASRRPRFEPDPCQGRCDRCRASLQPVDLPQRRARQPRCANHQGCRRRLQPRREDAADLFGAQHAPRGRYAPVERDHAPLRHEQARRRPRHDPAARLRRPVARRLHV